MEPPVSKSKDFFFLFTPHLNLSATSGSYEYFVFLVGGFSLVFGIPQISHCFPPLWRFIFLFTIPSTPIHSKIFEFIKMCSLLLYAFSFYIIFSWIVIYFKGMNYHLYHTIYISLSLLCCSHLFTHVANCSLKSCAGWTKGILVSTWG